METVGDNDKNASSSLPDGDWCLYSVVGEETSQFVWAFMAGEGMIVGSDGSLTDKEGFLDHVRRGVLKHDVMTTEAPSIRFHGDCAAVIAWGVSGGCYASTPFRYREFSSNVFAWQDGRWLCVLTRLSQHENV